MLNTRLLDSDQNLPLVVEPDDKGDGADARRLIALFKEHSDELDEKLLKHGAILFRGFGASTPAAFARVTRSVSSGLKESMEENVPRTKLSSGVYTSTEYPPEYMLSMHSEFAYSHNWPRRLFFGCIIAAQEGGETPIADNREVMRRLRPEIVDEFRRKRVTYLRNLHSGQGFGLSWQKAFQTEQKSDLEEYCRGTGVEFEWRDDGSLTLRQTLDGIVTHPETGDELWFNQAPQFHPSDYPEEIYKSVLSAYKSEDSLPQNVRFADGSPIDVEVLQEVRDVMKDTAVLFPWQEGDLLMVDNMLVSHGRMPFSGPRKILVAMS